MKKVFKTIVAVFILVLLFSALYSEEKSTDKKQVIITKYFDIIFSSESRESALILAEHADDLYLKACDLLDSEPYFRLPVSLISGVDVLNGYFTFSPYNHIVIYDTIPDEGSLAVFSESLCSVFYHELVHAVSMQKKSKAWKLAGKIFGDIFTIGPLLYTPLSFIEGVTVSLESKDGEGRLNDAFASHIILQAKIEGLFPEWQNVTGVRDIYPVGSLPYLFGGAFSAYLQDAYGMEKYATLWEAFGRLHFFGSLESIVKKTYDKNLVELWNEFQDSINVPDSKLLDPRTATEMTALQTKKSLYQFLTQSKKGYAWFDASSNEIWYESFETGRRKKLFTTSDGQQNISLSLDGDYLVSSYVQAYPFGQNTATVYYLQTQKKIQTFKGLRDACLVRLSDKKEYLAGVHTKEQIASLELWTFLAKEKEAKFQKTFPLNSIPFSITPLDDGKIAYILKEKNNWSIVLWDPLSDIEEKYLFQSATEPIKYLNPVFENNELIGLSFSYGEKDSLPKMAFLDFASQSFFIQTQEISGGLYYPLIKDSAIIFIAQFFEYDSVFVSPIDSIFQDAKIEEANTYLALEKETETNSLLETSSNTSLDFLNPSSEDYTIKKYNPLSFMTKGVFLPIVSLDIDENLSSDKDDIIFTLGFLWLSGDPFSKIQLQIQPSYDFFYERFHLNSAIAGFGIGLPLTLEGESVFGFDGYMTNSYDLRSQLEAPLGNSMFKISVETAFYYLNGRKNSNSDFINFFYNGNRIALTSLRKTNLSYFAKRGFTFGANLWIYDNESKKIFSDSNFNYSFFTSYSLPQIVPFNNPQKFTLNLPTRIEGSLFTSENIYAEEKALWSASAKTTLFAFELQKGFSANYFQRLALEADYSCVQKINSLDYMHPLNNFQNPSRFSDSIGIRAYFTSSMIAGMIISQLKFDMGGEFRYHIREHSSKWSFLMRVFY